MQATRRRPAVLTKVPRRRVLIARRAVGTVAPARSQRHSIRPRAAAARLTVPTASAHRSRRRVLTHHSHLGRLATTERRPALTVSRAAPRRCARRIWCPGSARRTRRRPSNRPRIPSNYIAGSPTSSSLILNLSVSALVILNLFEVCNISRND